MKRQLLLLLLGMLSAWVSVSESQEITVKELPDGIQLECTGDYQIKYPKGEYTKTAILENKDKYTGEYTCVKLDINKDDGQGSKIFVKFRTCDNCIELNIGAISGIAVGEVMATIVIAVAVYLVASKAKTGPSPTNKKSSDRQHLVPNEVTNRSTNDHYQPLRPRAGQKDTYDVLTNRR